MKGYLLDASAFIYLIRNIDEALVFRFVQESAVLDLTFYEVGNAIWKEGTLAKILSPHESEELAVTTQIILARMEKVTGKADGFHGILDLARKERLSFYDSSYLWSAKEKELTLVTGDKELYNKAKKHINVQKTADFTRA
jgi:predicted nucleic acid-binding protein